jgi:hypothetical protein
VTKKVIFIASLARSGSTLLDLMLGGHPRFVGLGEMFRMLTPDTDWLDRTREVLCSCGSTMDQCSFWGPVSVTLRRNQGVSIQKRYKILLDAFGEAFGKDCVTVDSSKHLKALQTLSSVPGVEVRVLHLIKDVRAWTVSMRDAGKRAEAFYIKELLRKHGWKAWIAYVRRTSAYYFLRWYFRNRSMQDFLKRERIPSFQLGYEELSLYPEFMMDDICEFLDVQVVDSMFSLLDSSSHSVLGNRMRSQMEKRQGIFYDNRWFSRNDWLLPAILFPHIMRYNAKEVYRNVPGALWSK